MRLNKTTVERIKAPEKGFTLTWDEAVSGFGVRTTAKGVKAYIVQSRANGQSRRVTLGRHGVITAEQARARAKIALGRMSEGIDPTETKRTVVNKSARDKALAVTLQTVWDEYRTSRRKDGKTRKQSTLDDMQGHLNRNFKEWLKRPITEITRDGVLAKHKAIAKRGTYQADQAMRYLRSLLNFARDLYTAPDGAPCLPNNPVDVLRSARQWHAPQRRRVVIPKAKLGKAICALERIATAPDELRSTQSQADLELFLMFTGLRLNEAAQVTLDTLDRDIWAISLPDPKNRTPTWIPLSDEAVAVLKRRPGNTEYLFEGRSDKYIRGTRMVRDRVAVEIESHFTNHDLRRTFTSIAAEHDLGTYTLKALLNHAVSNGDVTGGYVVPGFEHLRSAANKVGNYMRSQADAETRDNVVVMEARA